MPLGPLDEMMGQGDKGFLVKICQMTETKGRTNKEQSIHVGP